MWEEQSLLCLVKDYIVNIWEAWKFKLYGDDSSQSSTGDLGGFIGIEGQSGKIMGMCGSAYENGCVIEGMCATVAD